MTPIPGFLIGCEPFPGLDAWKADASLFIRENLGARCKDDPDGIALLQKIDALPEGQWTATLLLPECTAFLLREPRPWTWSQLAHAVARRLDAGSQASRIVEQPTLEMRDIMKRLGKGSRRETCEHAEFLSPASREFQDYRAKIHQATALLETLAPGFASELSSIVHGIALVDEQASFRGASGLTLRGLIMLSPEPAWTVGVFAEELVHETTHTLLDIVSIRQPLLAGEDAFKEQWPAPFRPDKRPLAGNFHALVVVSRLVHLFGLFRRSPVASEHDWAAKAFDYIGRATPALPSLHGYAATSPLARRLLDDLVKPTLSLSVEEFDALYPAPADAAPAQRAGTGAKGFAMPPRFERSTKLTARLVAAGPGSLPHLVKLIGSNPECMAVGYLDGTVLLSDASGRLIRFHADTDVIDVSADAARPAGRIAIATPDAALVFHFDWHAGPRAQVATHAARLEGHDGRVTAVALRQSSCAGTGFSSAPPPDGRGDERTAITADERGNVHFWGGAGFRLLGSVRAHRKAVHFLHSSVTRDGMPVFVTASDDRDVVVRDWDADRVYRRFNLHAGWVEQVVSVESEGTLDFLVVTDRVGTMIWDVEAAEVVARFRGRPRMDVAVTRDARSGVMVAVGVGQQVVVARDRRVYRLDAPGAGELRAVALTMSGDWPVLWMAVGTALYAQHIEDAACALQHEFPSGVLRMKSWTHGRGLIALLEDGSFWMMECKE